MIASSNPNGASAGYTYDDLNRLSTVVDNRLPGQSTTTYIYDMASNLAKVTYPNGVQTALSYDQLNRLKQLATSQTGYLYTFDAAGNRKSATEYNGRSVAWNFDGIYRLTSESITGAAGGENGNASYQLDPVGNRLSEVSSLGGVSSQGSNFNPDDELASESYDSNGNVTASGGKTFAYDSQNQLTSMGAAVTMVYDGDGNRVRKIVNGITTQYLVDDLNPTGYAQVVEELTNGALSRTYTYGLQRISENQIISNTWKSSFYGYDGFGTVRQLMNSAGTITDTYEYDAYGNHWTAEGTTPNNMLYRGEEWDPDLSLLYLRARYMNPLTGRFVSMDPEDGIPTDPETLHKYLYAGGDPVNKFDPSGRAEAVARPGTGGIEYGLIVGLISLQAAKALPVVAKAVSCILYTAASALEATAQNKEIIAIDSSECKVDAKCRPCVPPVGTISCRVDLTGKPHAGVPTPHYQLFEMNQNPNNCQCFWKKLKCAFACPAPPADPNPPGIPPIGPPGGGGPW